MGVYLLQEQGSGCGLLRAELESSVGGLEGLSRAGRKLSRPGTCTSGHQGAPLDLFVPGMGSGTNP